MDYIVETDQLTKSYKDRKVVDSVDLHVKKGEIYGFVGPNGAGKSTVLKMLLNLTHPDSGTVRIFGEIVSDQNYEFLRRMGSIIESPYFYDKMSGRKNLELHAGYMGYQDNKQIDEALELVSLRNAESKAVTNYSLGMKQRLAIARAILTKPNLLILDEPINALDPEGIREMRSLFRRLNEEWGTSIIISSHILSEVELIADTIGILKNGHLRKEISMDEIHDYNSDYIELEVNDALRAQKILKDKRGLSKYKLVSNQKLLIFDSNITGMEISSLLIQNGIGLETIRKQTSTLEDYFFQLTGEVE